MTGALAIFAKTPGLSPIKTRLAVDIGIPKAEQFYLHSVQCLEALALRVVEATGGDLVPYWAVGEENGLDCPLWQNMDRLWTGAGGLGERLDHVYSSLLKKHDHVILIGTDSPQLQPDILIAAHQHLRTKTGHVIGPAEDGGYYLYGGHEPLPHDLWLSVPYSVSTTCNIFVEKLTSHGRVHFLQMDFDVDMSDDLRKLLKRKDDMKTKPQRELLAWLASIEENAQC
ncbi:MAG: hypothetical protein AUJ12_06115 [Alphaproteobacteria bacterium CG1_02_46_17]|nr:MAG: hypothetical protein AUJ12_06115 [Alphaproteobacteria bacterium CG1_02_46_17]